MEQSRLTVNVLSIYLATRIPAPACWTLYDSDDVYEVDIVTSETVKTVT